MLPYKPLQSTVLINHSVSNLYNQLNISVY
jgi:hypothetical protein